ncbi:MAG: MFS transporter [Pseudomonadota bacterium]
MSQNLGFVGTVKSYPKTFWVSNVMEIFERMAWYGFFALSTLYITGSVDDGCLGFSSEDRGMLQGVVSFFVYLLPFLFGALGDRYGYKKMLLIAYCVLSPTYFLLGQFKSLPGFFAIFMAVGIGAAMFKPLIVSSIGKTTDKKNSSMGFGIFYAMVNIGGLMGPFIGAAIRSGGWDKIFIASSIWITINIPILLIFYKEPTAEAASKAKRSLKKVMSDMFEVLGNPRFFVMIFVLLFILVVGKKVFNIQVMFSLAGVWLAGNIILDIVFKAFGTPREWRMRAGNTRFLLFLLLLSSFWVSFNQIFMTLPEYIRDFTDSKSLMETLTAFFQGTFGSGAAEWFQYMFVEKDGTIKPEQVININAFCIIFCQIFISYIVARLKPLVTIILGVIITAVSFTLLVFGVNPILVMLGVVVFSFGEMFASPKAKEYTAHAVAPPDKVGLYMGYYMWCNALGALFGGLLSGELYGWLARDLQKPELMWLFFGFLALVCAVLLFGYHRIIGRKVEQENLAKAQQA